MIPAAVDFRNRQRRIPVDLAWLRRLGPHALRLALAHPGPGPRPLPALPRIEVTLLSDRRIAEVHARFLSDPTPTDVITFDHGEILIGAETAARNAARFHHPPHHELALLAIHGLLHLNGHDDHAPADFKRMKTTQNRILRQVLAATLALAAALAPLGAQPASPPIDREALLKALRELSERRQSAETDARRELLARINAAAASPSSAIDLYQEAIRATQFAGRSESGDEFRDWRKGKGETFRQQGGTRAAQLHLRYLALAIARSGTTSDEPFIAPLIAFTVEVENEPDEVRANELLRTPVRDSLFTRFLQCAQWLDGADKWEPAPANIDGIWEKTILPALRQRRDPVALRYWDERVKRETARASSIAITLDRERFLATRIPDLLWRRAKESANLGDTNGAIVAMFSVIRDHPTHPRSREWIAELETLLAPR